MHDGALTIDLSQTDGSSVITIEGEIDSHSVGELHAVFEGLRVDSNRVVIDMSGVRFMDSSGVSALIYHTLQLETLGGSLHIVNPSRPVHRVLEISGLIELFCEPQAQ
jgi:anti-sigma B factor antagonist